MERVRAVRPAPILPCVAGAKACAKEGGDILQLPLLGADKAPAARRPPAGASPSDTNATLLPSHSPTSIAAPAAYRLGGSGPATPIAIPEREESFRVEASSRKLSRTKLVASPVHRAAVADPPALPCYSPTAAAVPPAHPVSPAPADALPSEAGRRGSLSRKLAAAAGAAVPERDEPAAAAAADAMSTAADADGTAAAAALDLPAPAVDAAETPADDLQATPPPAASRPSSLGRSAHAHIPPPPPGPYPGKRAGRPSRASQPLNLALPVGKSGIAAWMKQQQQAVAADDITDGSSSPADPSDDTTPVASSGEFSRSMTNTVGHSDAETVRCSLDSGARLFAGAADAAVSDAAAAAVAAVDEEDASTCVFEDSTRTDAQASDITDTTTTAAAAAGTTSAAAPVADHQQLPCVAAEAPAPAAATDAPPAATPAALADDVDSDAEASLLRVGSSLFNGAYKITSRLGHGTFGEVYKAAYSATGALVAIKTATSHPHIVQMKREATAYVWCRKRCESIRLPNLHWSGPCRNQHIMILELLGSDVETLVRKMPHGKFTPRTTAQLGLEMLGLLETLHSEAGCIHNDIKPANFAMKGRDLYLIDLGLARPWQDANGEAIKYDPSAPRGFCGTPRFASLNSHRGEMLSRRDDLESVCYALVYLLKGRLPWSELKTTEEVAASKAEVVANPETLVGNHPFLTPFYHSVLSLGFHDEPDYKHLAGILTRWRDKVGWRGQYDWESKHYAHLFASASEELYNTPELPVPVQATAAAVDSTPLPANANANVANMYVAHAQQQQQQQQAPPQHMQPLQMVMPQHPPQAMAAQPWISCGMPCAMPPQDPAAAPPQNYGAYAGCDPHVIPMGMPQQGALALRGGARGGKTQGYTSMPSLPPLGGLAQGVPMPTPAEHSLPLLAPGDCSGNAVPSPPSCSPPPMSRRTLTGRPHPPPQGTMYPPAMLWAQQQQQQQQQQYHEGGGGSGGAGFARNPRSKYHPKAPRGANSGASGRFPHQALVASGMNVGGMDYAQPQPQPQRDPYMIYPTPPPQAAVNAYLQ